MAVDLKQFMLGVLGTPENKTSTQAVLEPQTGKIPSINPLAFMKDVLQGTARSGGSVGLTLASPITKKEEIKPEEMGTVQKKLYNIIFGEEPLKTIQTRAAEASLTLEKYGLPKEASIPTALLAVGGLTALDFTGLGGEKKVITTLAKASNIESVLKTLKNIGIADDVAVKVAPILVKTTDEKAVKSILDSVKKITPKVPVVSKELSPLIQEAKKAVADGEYLYHGTSETVLDNISKEGLKPGMRKFTSLSKDEKYSMNWAKGGITPQGKTEGVMLRVNKDLIKDKILPSKSGVPSDKLNEVLTKETISPENLEIYKNGKWQPLIENPLIAEAKKYKSAQETLPKEISVYEEAKAVGAKRIAPDRVAHQQLTPEQGINALIEKAQKRAENNSNSWIKVSDTIQNLINKYGDKLPKRTAETIQKYPNLMDDFYKYNDLKKYANSSSLSEMKDEFLQKAERVKWNPLMAEKYNQSVIDEYKNLVKADISKGYKYPDEVLNYDKSFKTAVDNRARYEKGLATSFSADDSRIVFDEQNRIIAGMKRQDGKELLPAQKQEIIDGVLQTQEALGIDLNQLSKDERWVYAHLNGKNPFLTKNAAGMYRKGSDYASVSLGGSESFDAIINGEKVRRKVNTTAAHEIGHALDGNVKGKLIDDTVVWDLKRTFKPVENSSRGDKYWRSDSEVTARAIEEYVAVKEGHIGLFNKEGYWTKEIFESKIKPAVEKAIDIHFPQYKTKSQLTDIWNEGNKTTFPELVGDYRKRVEAVSDLKAFTNDPTHLGKGVSIHEATELPIYDNTPKVGLKSNVPPGHNEALKKEIEYYKSIVPELNNYSDKEIDRVVIGRLHEKYGKYSYGNEMTKPIEFKPKTEKEIELYNIVREKLDVPIKKALPQEQLSQKAGKLLPEAKATLPQTPITPELSQLESQVSSLVDNTIYKPKSQVNLGLNVKNFNISDEAKTTITNEIENIKPQIEAKVGKVLTNKEVKEFADNTSRVLSNAVGVEQTKAWNAAQLNLKRIIAKQSQEGVATKEYLENLLADKTLGTDLARKLQARSIKADPRDIPVMQNILEGVLKFNDNIDEILKKAQGVNFNDFNQATKFYREFVKPTTSEWLDLLRYNSMLSSPLTHFVNIFSNLQNSAVIAPVEKMIAGGIDFLSSKIFQKERKMFAGEGGAFLKGYVKNLQDATKRFAGVMSGSREFTQLDIKNIPIAVEGVKGKLVKTLSFPMRALEAADQFFTSLVEGGEKASLIYRQGKGVATKNADIVAKDKAMYRLFRSETNTREQGTVLNAVDALTNLLQRARTHKNPIVSNVAKFTVPFLRTPMNIFKQGIEYSPLGFATLIKAENKTEQMAKAVLGSTVFGTAGFLLGTGKLTWSEPISEKERSLWKESGRQAYSIKIGDKWVSYQKLAPALAFPLAMVSSLNDLIKNRRVSDDVSDYILGAVSKYGKFLSDQSYVKSIGDLIRAVQGEEAGISRLVSNYPQQLIPFRALGGWLSRMIDESERKIDSQADFIDKQMQLLMLNIPFLSKKVPARTTETGEIIKKQNRITNAFMPVQIKKENQTLGEFLNDYDSLKKQARDFTDLKNEKKQNAETLYQELKKLPSEEAKTKLKELAKTDKILVEQVLEVAKEEKMGLTTQDKIVKGLGVENGVRAKYIFNQINKLQTDEEKKAYLKELARKKILTDAVLKQVISLKNTKQ